MEDEKEGGDQAAKEEKRDDLNEEPSQPDMLFRIMSHRFCSAVVLRNRAR